MSTTSRIKEGHEAVQSAGKIQGRHKTVACPAKRGEEGKRELCGQKERGTGKKSCSIVVDQREGKPLH